MWARVGTHACALAVAHTCGCASVKICIYGYYIILLYAGVVCVCVCVRACVRACVRVSVCRCMRTYMRMCVRAHVRTRVRTRANEGE